MTEEDVVGKLGGEDGLLMETQMHFEPPEKPLKRGIHFVSILTCMKILKVFYHVISTRETAHLLWYNSTGMYENF